MRCSSKLRIGLAALAVLMVADSALAYYSPALGRFVGRDPIQETGAALIREVAERTAFVPRDPLGWEEDLSTFCYALNSPANYVDPLGLSVWDWLTGDNRVWDWVDCMADCIQDNDPAGIALTKLAAVIGGTPLPKSMVVKLADLVGDHKLAEAIRKARGAFAGQSRFTTLPSVVANKLKGLTGKQAARALRTFGRYAAPATVAYGLALAAVEAHCTGWCCGTRDYDPIEGNIIHELKRRFFSD